MKHPLRLLTALAVAAFAACGGSIEVSITETEARLALHACEMPLADSGAQCGTLSVPENRDIDDGRTLRLPVVILPAKSRGVGADPVVILGGGPGSSTIAAFASLPAAALAEHPLRQHQDLIVLDQRGTPLAKPGSLDCPELVRDYANGERFASASELATAAMACRARLTALGADLAHYDSATSAKDLDDLRRLLGPAWGFQRWHVIGTSYGSRLALAYAGAYGSAVRSLTLDGPLPPQVNALYDASVLEALDRVVAACAANAGCAPLHPSLRERFAPAVERLVASPTRLGNGASVTAQAVLGALRGLLAAGQADVALAAMEFVSQGRFDEADALLGLSVWIDLAPNPSGMYTSVMCRDEAGHPALPGPIPAQGQGWSTSVRIAAATHSNPTLSTSICPAWLFGQPTAAMPEPVRYSGPTLVTVGEFDPLTPISNADRIRSHMPQTRTVTLAQRGHGLLESDACAVELAAAFIRNPSAALDTTCAAAPF